MRLGAARVRCVMLPYKFTAQVSLDDAAACAKALGVSYEVLPIADAVEGLEAVLGAGICRQSRATSPKKICRRAPAAQS